MNNNYILIDFENVPHHDIALLHGLPYKIIIFVGASQTKIPFEMASEIQKFGSNAEYYKIEGTGHNALDFHIAFYLGRISQQDPSGHFYIVSKDKGFDPLVHHLQAKKIHAQRISGITEIPETKASNASSITIDKKIDDVIKHLIGRGQFKPTNMKTLRNDIGSFLKNRMGAKELDGLIEQLTKRGFIAVNERNKVIYKLPVGKAPPRTK